MPTLFLTARHTDDTQALWRACIAEKWKIERIHNWRVPAVDPADVAVYGEPLFADHVARTLGLGLMAPSADWLARLAPQWRMRDVRLMTLAEARKVQHRSFMKPAEEKCFEARVYGSGAELPAAGSLPEDLPVLVQEPVEWSLEFRCFVLDQHVTTTSPYWREGRLAKGEDEMWVASDAETNAAFQFCERVLKDPGASEPRAFVVDVGIIRDRGWAVVEGNAAWGSGIYGCDPAEVLKVLRCACYVK